MRREKTRAIAVYVGSESMGNNELRAVLKC